MTQKFIYTPVKIRDGWAKYLSQYLKLSLGSSGILCTGRPSRSRRLEVR